MGLGRWRLPRRVPGLGAGDRQDRLRGGGACRRWTPAPLAAARRGAAGGATVRGRPAEVGGGAGVCVAGPFPAPEEGLRVPAGHFGGGHPPAVIQLLVRRLAACAGEVV